MRVHECPNMILSLLKKQRVVYCKACKEDPTTEPVEMCNYCALAEIRQSYKDKDKIHEEH